MLKIVIYTFFLLFSLFVLPTKVNAVFTIGSGTTSINSDQSITVDVTLTISGSSGNTYYLRGALAHIDSPTSYFGFTQDSSGAWYNGSPSPVDTSKYYHVIMDSNNSWTGAIVVKPDMSDTAYKGSGSYILKLGRYTQTGSTATWADNNISLSIAAIPSPVPTPVPSPSPTPTPLPVVSPSPTSITVVKASPVPSPTPIKHPSPIPTPSSSLDLTSNEGTPEPMVLGINQMTPEPSPSPKEATTSGTLLGNLVSKVNPLASVMILAGVGLLGFSLYSFFGKSISGRIDGNA